MLNFSFPENNYYNSYQEKILRLINKENDELGPYSHSGAQGWDYFFYADNEGEDFDIKFVRDYPQNTDGRLQTAISRPENMEGKEQTSE